MQTTAAEATPGPRESVPAPSSDNDAFEGMGVGHPCNALLISVLHRECCAHLGSSRETQLFERIDHIRAIVIVSITSLRQSRSLPPGNLRFRLCSIEQRPHSPVGTRNISLLGLWMWPLVSEFVIEERKRYTDDPSFFPIGSSYSTPTHRPEANLVLPTNRTVPRLWKPGSVDSIWHLEPT